MAQHELETTPKPEADASAADWEKYIEGIKSPAAGASAELWDEYWRLTEEASEEAPDAVYAGRTPTAHEDLIGVGAKIGKKKK